MWDYVFDYQQRIILKDKLSANELLLLFYFSKSIISEEFVSGQEVSLFKTFNYREVLEALPILNIEVKQLKRLISKLVNAGYIKKQNLFAGINICLTKKSLHVLSKKQSETVGVKKYFLLLTWSKMSKLASELGQKCPSWLTYYNINTKNNNISNIYNIEIDTQKDNNYSSNISCSIDERLVPLFEKYPKFKVDRLTLLPVGFKCDSLLAALDKSLFLQNNPRIDFDFLMDNYHKIITGYYDDYKQPNQKEEHKAFISRNYTAEELDSLFDNLDEIDLYKEET